MIDWKKEHFHFQEFFQLKKQLKRVPKLEWMIFFISVTVTPIGQEEELLQKVTES